MKLRRALTLGFVVFSLWLLIMYLGVYREGTSFPKNRVSILEIEIEDATKEHNILFDEFTNYLAKLRDQKRLQKLTKQDEERQKISSKAFKEEKVASPILKSSTGDSNFSSQELQEISRQQPIPKNTLEDSRPVIAVLVFSCDRVSIRRSLDRLIQFRPSKEQFPIIVSQDCSHEPTTKTILNYGDQLYWMKHPDQSDIQVPPKEKKFKGYFKIARHYGWALNQTFNVFGFSTVIVVEDDLEVSTDFYEYFLGTFPLLRADPSLWCVSAWNDNGNEGLVDSSQKQLLYRTDFFPGLGWMLTDNLWRELANKWPKSYWDDWIRKPEQRKSRACIRPEISRTKTFGKVGVSNGMFYEKHLKFIKLNDEFVGFTKLNLTYLLKENYDSNFFKEVYASHAIEFHDLGEFMSKPGSVRLTYKTKERFKGLTKKLGLMDDFRSGVPRTAYNGIVTTYWLKSKRIYIVPEEPWSGYDISWG